MGFRATDPRQTIHEKKGQTKVKIPQKTYETVEPGLYRGTIQSIEEDEGKFGPQLKYTIFLEDSDVTLTAWTSQAFSPKSKLYRWAMACFGGSAIPDGYVLDTDSLLNRPVMVNVITKDTETGTFNRVVDLLPIPKTQKPTKTTAAKPAPANEAPPWEQSQEVQEPAGLPL